MAIIILYKKPLNYTINGKDFIEILISELQLSSPPLFLDSFETARSKIKRQNENYITSTLSKSERYEIFCKSKTLKQPLVTIYFENPTDLEDPNINKYKQDRNSIKFEDYTDFEIIKEILDKQFNNVHTKSGHKSKLENKSTVIKIENSESMNKISIIVSKVKNRYKKAYDNENLSNILEEGENSFYRQLALKSIDVKKVEAAFTEIIEFELIEKGIKINYL